MDSELKSGSVLGHYELLTRLARGGMASVWVARDGKRASGKPQLVALKAMLPELGQHSDFRSMFLDEGQIVRSIDHPNVVKVHEVSEERGILYMAMDWVEGDSLRTLIKEARRRRAIPAEMAVRIIADAASGLHAAHELRGWDGELRNIVHGDISPHNILVGIDGRAKLVDFGVAHAAVQSELAEGRRMKGKFAYMSPEQANAGPVDRRSDVFALGVVLFELTTGDRLFHGEDPAHTLGLVKNAKIPTPHQAYAGYPEALSAIVKRALARDVNERFQTAAELGNALERYLKDARILVSPAGVGQLVKRVLGARIERQRDTLREALLLADGALASELPRHPPSSAGPSPALGDASLERMRLSSEPPSGASKFSRSGTSHHPQTVEATRAPSGLLPAICAVGGMAAAASAVFWVMHRPGPPPFANGNHPPTRAAASTPHDEATGPAGVNVDSLPTAGTAPAETKIPSAEAMTDALFGRNPAATDKPVHTERPSTTAVTAEGATRPSASSPASASISSAPVAPSGPPARTNGLAALDRTDSPVPALVPASLVTTSPSPPPGERPPLNRGAALAALNSAAVQVTGCKRADGPTGPGSANITFSADGPVSAVSISAPFAGTSVGQCVVTVFHAARVPAFSGSSFTLPKSFRIPE